MNIEKTYLKMNAPEKREMFETILMKDVAVFNMMMSSLDDAHQVAHVGMNGMVIQLTIHPVSNVEGENNWCDKCEKDIYPEIPETNNFCKCKESNDPDVVVSCYKGTMTLEKAKGKIGVQLKDYDIDHCDEDYVEVFEDDGGRYIVV